MAPLSCPSHDDDAHDMDVMYMAIMATIAIWDPILMVLGVLNAVGTFWDAFATKTFEHMER